jgi:hypothetical protein
MTNQATGTFTEKGASKPFGFSQGMNGLLPCAQC